MPLWRGGNGQYVDGGITTWPTWARRRPCCRLVGKDVTVEARDPTSRGSGRAPVMTCLAAAQDRRDRPHPGSLRYAFGWPAPSYRSDHGELRGVAQGNDTLLSVEDARGTPSSDTLIGNAEPNVLDGGPRPPRAGPPSLWITSKVWMETIALSSDQRGRARDGGNGQTPAWVETGSRLRDHGRRPTRPSLPHWPNSKPIDTGRQSRARGRDAGPQGDPRTTLTHAPARIRLRRGGADA